MPAICILRAHRWRRSLSARSGSAGEDAVDDVDRAVAVGGDPLVVGDDDRRSAPRLHLRPDQLHDLCAELGVERRGRLVEQHERGARSSAPDRSPPAASGRPTAATAGSWIGRRDRARRAAGRRGRVPACLARRPSSSTTSRFSRAVRNGTRFTDWNTNPTVILAERRELLVGVAGDLLAADARSQPSVAERMPPAIEHSVVLPEPDGPTSATISSRGHGERRRGRGRRPRRRPSGTPCGRRTSGARVPSSATSPSMGAGTRCRGAAAAENVAGIRGNRSLGLPECRGRVDAQDPAEGERAADRRPRSAAVTMLDAIRPAEM